MKYCLRYQVSVVVCVNTKKHFTTVINTVLYKARVFGTLSDYHTILIFTEPTLKVTLTNF